jgi:Uma2 family endonuclease
MRRTAMRRDPRFNRDDYRRLPESYPVQLIEGDFVKEPAPTGWHQRVVVEFLVRLRAVAGPDRVLCSPVDVDVDFWNVLQPDVLAYAEGERVTPDGPEGRIPILAAEVLSPSTARRDRERKVGIYLRAGVEEVWLVDPDAGTIEIHARDVSGGTAATVARFGPDETAASRAVPGFRTSWRELSGGR